MAAPLTDAEKRRRMAWATVITLWAALIIGVLIRSLLKPGSGTVFPIFHTAGARWLHGENLYSGGTDYLYSPLVAALFSPLALLPLWAANIVWRLGVIATYLIAVRAWLRGGTARIPEKNHPLVFLLLLPLSIGSINNAQANPLVVALVMFAIIATRSTRWAMAALCIGVIAYLKIYPLAAGLLLCVIFPQKLSWRLVAVLVAFGALSFILQKPAYVAEQYHNWVATRRVDERHHDIMNRPRDLWTLLAACGIELNLRFYFYLQILGGGVIAALCFIGRPEKLDRTKLRILAGVIFLQLYFVAEKLGNENLIKLKLFVGWLTCWLIAEACSDLVGLWKWKNDRLLTLIFTLVCCWMLLLGPATESSTYILLAPAISLAAVEAFSRPFPTWMRALVATALTILIGGGAFIAFAGRRRDLWSMSVQQIGTVLFAVFALAWVFRDPLWRDAEAKSAT